MSDIVERLRCGAGHEPADILEAERIMDEAADEIERLRAENKTFRAAQKACEDCDPDLAEEVKRLRAALLACLQVACGEFRGEPWEAIDMARKALRRSASGPTSGK